MLSSRCPERQLARAILSAQSYLNPELHPGREALSPEQYRMIFQRFLAKKGFTLDSKVTKSLMTEHFEVDRLSAAMRTRSEAGRSYKNFLQVSGIKDG